MTIRIARAIVACLVAVNVAGGTGCRTVVIAEPDDDQTRTIVTVKRVPATQPD